MPVTEQDFRQLFDVLRAIDLFGDGPPEPPWGTQPDVQSVQRAIDGAAEGLPLLFEDTYVDPLRTHVPHLLALVEQDPGEGRVILETIVAAVYDHGVEEVAAPLHRFLAVVSNFYRSFLDAERRIRADFPLAEALPPLAMFQHSGRSGPFTVPVDGTHDLFGAAVGVVSLPSTYRNDPLLWASLAHETGGHDVLHADTDLLPELAGGVRNFFGGGPVMSGQITGAHLLGLLWSYWIDEAASDVYGLLNIGPSFGLNLIVFFAALNARAEGSDQPSLRTATGRDPMDILDPHPIDILRPHLAIGVVQSLARLSEEARNAYVQDLNMLAELCAPGVTEVEVVGSLPRRTGGSLPLNVRLPLAPMQDAARRVGAFIASTRLQALGGHSIQDLETWDDPDEAAALRIADILTRDASAVAAGDDAQLLAGATVAAMNSPGDYEAITRRLGEALDHSYSTDPYWGTPKPDLLFIPFREVDQDALLDRYAVGVRLVGREAEAA